MGKRAVLLLALRLDFTDPPGNEFKVGRKEAPCIVIEEDST